MPTVIGDSVITPTRQTRDQLVSQVTTYLSMPSHTEATTFAQNEINNAIRRLNSRTWNWSLESDDLTLVNGQQTYNIAATFKAARIAQLLNPAGNYVSRLDYLDPSTFDDVYTGRVNTGDPVCYTVYNYNDAITSGLNLSCGPSTSFVAQYPTIRLKYLTRIPTFSSSTSFPGPSEAEEFVVWYARYACSIVLTPERAPAAKRERDECWALLVRDDNEIHFHDWEH